MRDFNLDRFNDTFLSLQQIFETQGFVKNPSRFEDQVFGSFFSFQDQMYVITSRVKADVQEVGEQFDYVFKCLKDDKSITQRKMRKYSYTFSRTTIDLTDFFLYSRIFLDTISACIYLSFRVSKNPKANLLGQKIKFYLDPHKLSIYKKEVDPQFFVGLEPKLNWINDFKKSRDDIVHLFSNFVFTTGKSGELGYDLKNHLGDASWGTETVAEVYSDLQGNIDHLTELMEYLCKSLPRLN